MMFLWLFQNKGKIQSLIQTLKQIVTQIRCRPSTSETLSSAMIKNPYFWLCLFLCLSVGHVSAQPTTDRCTPDDDRGRQVALMEQTLAILQSVDSRLLSVDRRLQSVEQRVEEKTRVCEADHENGRSLLWHR